MDLELPGIFIFMYSVRMYTQIHVDVQTYVCAYSCVEVHINRCGTCKSSWDTPRSDEGTNQFWQVWGWVKPPSKMHG